MKRVVVTGMGVVAPLGNDISTFWNNIVAGKSGAKTIHKFDAGKFKCRFACQVEGFQPELYLDRNEIKRTDPFTQYALVAAKQAVDDSGFDFSKMSPFDVGVIWGSGQGGMATFEEQVEEYVVSGHEPRFSPFFVPKLIVNMASGMISLKFGFMGINYTTVSACATSNTAIMDAMNYIRMGKAKICLLYTSPEPTRP